MTLGGWIVMIVSVSAVTIFFAYNLYHSLRNHDEP
jgi:hypothetical protein